MEQVLGHKTFAQNLRACLEREAEIEASWLPIDWDRGSWAGGLPGYRGNWTVNGGLQARGAVARAWRGGRLDGLFFHTQVMAVLAQDWLARLPGVVSLDATPLQYDSLGEFYTHAKGPAALEKLKWRLNRDCFRKAKRLVTWSEWARQSLIADYGIPGEKVSVVPPGVPVDLWENPHPPRERGCVRILFVGGDLARKGGTHLLEAFRSLGDLKLELHLVTKDTLAPEPGVFVHHGLQPNSPELVELFHSSDIFCLPTLGDCLPMVLSEAGAAGLPLVSTAVAAIPEVVVDGQSGLLVKAGEAAGLAAALRRLAEDAELRARLGAGARELVRARHDAGKNGPRLLDILKQTIQEGRAGL